MSLSVAFTLNGELLQGSFDSTIAFEDINTSGGLMPAITLSAGQRAQLNFGKSEVGYMWLLVRSVEIHVYRSA